ncbi:MAG: dTMP kinase [Alphaproteobacteria bacterium]|nr:dTMP kinase [Alphaproteobacteria bacterium]
MKKFIVFEGLDGSGKTTQVNLLADSLKKIKKDFFLTREPGGTIISERIRKILVQKNKSDISPQAELLLIYAARYEHVKNKIIPNLQKRIVICDRFFYSTYCYQIFASKIPPIHLNYLHKHFGFNLFPDLNILINTDTKISIKRSLKIKKLENRFETKSNTFHKSVQIAFKNLSKKRKVVEFNGNENEIDLHKNIIDYLNNKKFFNFLLPYAVS